MKSLYQEAAMDIGAILEKKYLAYTDRYILLSALFEVEAVEVFGGEKSAMSRRSFKVSSCLSIDLVTGWDFTKERDQRSAWWHVLG